MNVVSLQTDDATSPSVSCGNCCTKLIDVSVRYGKQEVLKSVNLHIHCGQMTAIIGPNGAGKTTLFRAILGEIPYTGTIYNKLSCIKGNRLLTIGYVPQKLDFDVTSPVTVLDLFAASISRRPAWLGHGSALKKQAADSLERVDAALLAKSRLGTLSGGQLQRVLLALALTPVPDLLLLDEPVSGVDPAGIELFYAMVSELRRQHDLAVIMISHDCGVAARYADRMLFLNRSILCDNTPANVLKSEVVIKTFGRIAIPESMELPQRIPVCSAIKKEAHT